MATGRSVREDGEWESKKACVEVTQRRNSSVDMYHWACVAK